MAWRWARYYAHKVRELGLPQPATEAAGPQVVLSDGDSVVLVSKALFTLIWEWLTVESGPDSIPSQEFSHGSATAPGLARGLQHIYF